MQEVFQKKNEIDTAKKIFTKDDEATLMKENAAGDDGKGEKAATANKTGQDDEELGEADDIDDNVSEAVSRKGRG